MAKVFTNGNPGPEPSALRAAPRCGESHLLACTTHLLYRRETAVMERARIPDGPEGIGNALLGDIGGEQGDRAAGRSEA